MAKYCITFFIITFIIFIIASESTPTHLNYKNWREHNNRIAKFKCHQPQPRLIPISDLMDISTIAPRVLPSSTVLHRCESSGCCPGGKKCSPIATEDVPLVFGVLGVTLGMQYIDIVAKNHTKCGCMKFENR